jgi:UPF0716 protein FxsA
MSTAGSARTTSPWGRWIRAFLALTVLAEIIVVLVLGRFLGAPLTAMILLAFSAAGVVVLKQTVRRLFPPRLPDVGPSGTASVRTPPDGRQVAESVPLLGAGVLMTVPGVLTGVLGTLLLFAPIRRALRPVAVRVAAPVLARMRRDTSNPQVIPGIVIDDAAEQTHHVDVEVIEISPPESFPDGDDSPNRS